MTAILQRTARPAPGAGRGGALGPRPASGARARGARHLRPEPSPHL